LPETIPRTKRDAARSSARFLARDAVLQFDFLLLDLGDLGPRCALLASNSFIVR
jgi:hypothetical protein